MKEQTILEDGRIVRVGDKVKIICMKGEVGYDGKEGKVTLIDDTGKLFGSWGGLAVIPEEDEIMVTSMTTATAEATATGIDK